MAYLFLSQHQRANAGEWSCDTYGSEEYRGLWLSANVRPHTLDACFNIGNLFLLKSLIVIVKFLVQMDFFAVIFAKYVFSPVTICSGFLKHTHTKLLLNVFFLAQRYIAARTWSELQSSVSSCILFSSDLSQLWICVDAAPRLTQPKRMLTGLQKSIDQWTRKAWIASTQTGSSA